MFLNPYQEREVTVVHRCHFEDVCRSFLLHPDFFWWQYLCTILGGQVQYLPPQLQKLKRTLEVPSAHFFH